MLEHGRHDLIAAQEVDKEHSDHGVAAELVERDDSPLRSLFFNHGYRPYLIEC